MMFQTDALLLRRTEYRDSDLVVQLFTQSLGKLSALARGARKSRTRFAGTIESLHTLRVELTESRRGELFDLRSAQLARPRHWLTTHLDRMDAAGRVLRWIRDAAPERTPEPRVYQSIIACLDSLDEATPLDTKSWLATAGLLLVSDFGWALEFNACAACGAPCPTGKSARVDARRGGLVCTACGGGGAKLNAEQRRRLSRASTGDFTALLPEDADLALKLTEEVLNAHANLR